MYLLLSILAFFALGFVLEAIHNHPLTLKDLIMKSFNAFFATYMVSFCAFFLVGMAAALSLHAETTRDLDLAASVYFIGLFCGAVAVACYFCELVCLRINERVTAKHQWAGLAAQDHEIVQNEAMWVVAEDMRTPEQIQRDLKAMAMFNHVLRDGTCSLDDILRANSATAHLARNNNRNHNGVVIGNDGSVEHYPV